MACLMQGAFSTTERRQFHLNSCVLQPSPLLPCNLTFQHISATTQFPDLWRSTEHHYMEIEGFKLQQGISEFRKSKCSVAIPTRTAPMRRTRFVVAIGSVWCATTTTSPSGSSVTTCSYVGNRCENQSRRDNELQTSMLRRRIDMQINLELEASYNTFPRAVFLTLRQENTLRQPVKIPSMGLIDEPQQDNDHCKWVSSMLEDDPSDKQNYFCGRRQTACGIEVLAATPGYC